jgi:hypothetical protein
MHNNLLLLLQSLHNTNWNLEHVRHDIRGRERKPLRQTNICHALTLVNFDEGQVLRRGCVLNVMPRVVGKHSGVPGLEVEGTAVGVAGEDGGARGARVEVEPFLRLNYVS